MRLGSLIAPASLSVAKGKKRIRGNTAAAAIRFSRQQATERVFMIANKAKKDRM